METDKQEFVNNSQIEFIRSTKRTGLTFTMGPGQTPWNNKARKRHPIAQFHPHHRLSLPTKLTSQTQDTPAGTGTDRDYHFHGQMFQGSRWKFAHFPIPHLYNRPDLEYPSYTNPPLATPSTKHPGYANTRKLANVDNRW